MKTFQSHLKAKIKNRDFKKHFEEEKQILELAISVQELREKHGMTQSELANLAGITQQQLSRLENGTNCNISTFLKICHALNVQVKLKPLKGKLSA